MAVIIGHCADAAVSEAMADAHPDLVVVTGDLCFPLGIMSLSFNNASLEYKGIRLTYGMSIDYLAQPGISKESKQRGAELITIHADSTWDSYQIPLDSIA